MVKSKRCFRHKQAHTCEEVHVHIHHPLHQTAWYHVPEGLTVRSFLPLANGIAVRPRGQSRGGGNVSNALM